MSDFSKAFLITMGNEGGYNSGVGEAETYCGIDRSMNPNWSGWKVIDGLKPLSVSQMNAKLAINAEIQKGIRDFYQVNYWNPYKLGLVNNQQVAENLFDCSVNPCIDGVAEVMQKATNAAIIAGGRKSGLISVDKQIGDKTIAAINSVAPRALYEAINAIRLSNYYNRGEQTPSMKSWVPIWINRLHNYQS
ncbi:MAG TPA: glycosyl hydrolase 108 family protein [Candidatus Babeliaceae bacterium]|nr:glycosyl hydrolase 108 family protein [Candidatus Babeliaceae bacterium]